MYGGAGDAAGPPATREPKAQAKAAQKLGAHTRLLARVAQPAEMDPLVGTFRS